MKGWRERAAHGQRGLAAARLKGGFGVLAPGQTCMLLLVLGQRDRYMPLPGRYWGPARNKVVGGASERCRPETIVKSSQ